MKTVKTPKGTELPLINLKGKDYLQVAHRLQWLNEVEKSFSINTEVVKAEKDESIVRATVTIYGDNGQVVRSVSATKREDSKGFADHLEKAETGAVGRCLALCGFGTQFALSDLDEGDRIVDSPVTNVRAASSSSTQSNTTAVTASKPVATAMPSSSSSSSNNGGASTIKPVSPFKMKPKATASTTKAASDDI